MTTPQPGAAPTVRLIDKDAAEAHSADLVQANIARLRALFPDAFSEGRIDFEVLKSLLGAEVDEREEKYGLNWHGKRRARQLALTPSTGTLRPCPEESVDWETTQNLMIEGDNLEVLKLLQKSYAGKVKLIYIDPPYNTGKDFVYPDSFQDSIKNYLELTGQVEGGQKITSNTEASGRFHTAWLNMIYPRVKLARGLLRHDGIFFMSIGQAEIENALHVCNDVFGEESRIGIVGRSMKSGGNSGKFFSPNLEFILAYAQNTELASGFKDRMSQSLIDTVYNQVQTSGPRAGQFYRTMGLYQASLTLGRSRNARYFIDCPDGTKCIPPEGKRWRVIDPSYKEMLTEGDIEFKQTDTSPLLDENGKQSAWNVYTKIWLQDREEEGQIPVDILTKFENRHSAKELLDIGVPFPFAKPSALIKHLLEISQTSGDDLVLDFFSGSGTSGHAVWALNAQDQQERRFILVQLPEPLSMDDAEQADALALCDALQRPRNLAELGKERLRRAIQIVRREQEEVRGDLGFRVFKLDTSNIRAWNADPGDLQTTLEEHTEHLLPNRSEQDLLYELLLKLGLDLAVPIETRQIAGKTVHNIGAGALMACLSDGIDRDVAEPLALGIAQWQKAQAEALQAGGDDKNKPVGTKLVFKDSAFTDDVAKTNLAAILSQHGLDDVRSI